MKRVFIVDGLRTPFLKCKGKPGMLLASDLAVTAGRALLARQPFLPENLDEVIMGCVIPKVSETNIGRLLALRLGCGIAVPGWTVQRNCASGLQALDCAARNIAMGDSQLVLAGGAEAMSHAPLLYNDAMVSWLSDLGRQKTPMGKLRMLGRFRARFLTPVISLLQGLTDPVVQAGMGQTAEEIATLFGVTRLEMDAWAVRSHKRATDAEKNHHFQAERVPAFLHDGRSIQEDEGVRYDASLESLARLKPVFESYGNVTAGNSSPISDGAACLILASEKAVKQYQLPVLGEWKNVAWVGVEPMHMGLGPVHAMHQVLHQSQLSLKDIDYIELNEAFAAQILACQRAWADPDYCHKALGSATHRQELPLDKVNVDGGAIALGHPVGASGARIVLHLLHTLRRHKKKRGLASLCIGGGQGGAVLVEAVDE
jgi:acetyl-CoA C-acetyltransferase